MFGIRSVLVIPFADGIGDFINMQALLPAIQARFPDATVSVAASEHGAPLSNDPAVRLVKPAAFNNVPGKVMPRVRWLLPQAFVAWLAGPAWDRELGPFDLVINCFYAWERAMDFRRSWTPQIPAVPDVVHTIDCLAGELESALGVVIAPETRRPTLTLRPAAQAWAAEFLTAQELDPARPLVAFVPGTNMQIKRWPLERWTALDARLRAVAPDVQTVVFVDRAPDESTIGAAFAAAGSAALPIYAPLDRVAALLPHCDVVVGVDTGLLHMAAALDVAWVGLFGPTNPDVTGPYDPSRGEALVAPFRKPASCDSCWKQAFKYEDDRCRTLAAGSCMDHLTVGRVLGATLRRLADVHPLPAAARAAARRAALAGRAVPVGPALGY